MANFLTQEASFVWLNFLTDRNLHLENLNDTLVVAREEGDSIFRTPNLFDFGWGSIFETLWTNATSYDEIKAIYEWISPDAFIILSNMHGMFGGTTLNEASNWDEFNADPTESPKAMIGLENLVSEPFVYDLITWKSLHGSYVKSFNYSQRCSNYAYFKKYFVPDLTITEQEIRNQIASGSVHSSIIHFHSPNLHQGYPLHGEQYHVHFGGSRPCALNINGTWKHFDSRFVIPMATRETLSSWGFLLPDTYYI